MRPWLTISTTARRSTGRCEKRWTQLQFCVKKLPPSFRTIRNNSRPILLLSPPVAGIKPLPRDDAGMVIENPTLPLIAHLPPVQRRQFASMLLFGVHPLLTLVPTDRLVDLPCDHPHCPVVLGVGVNNAAGMKFEMMPLQ